MKKLILALMLMMVTPAGLEPAYHIYYVPIYPCTIMDTGIYRYILDGPGGGIMMEEKVDGSTND